MKPLKTNKSGCLNVVFGIFFLPFRAAFDITKNVANPKTRRNGLIMLGTILASCTVCFATTSILGAITPAEITPTADLVSIQDTAIAEAWRSYTQTLEAMPTETSAPTETSLPTETLTNTATSEPTATLEPLPTATLIIIVVPTVQPALQAVCSCSSDTYNCSDFSKRSSAQACYNYCRSVGAGDIHRLDSDGDGLACESLP